MQLLEFPPSGSAKQRWAGTLERQETIARMEAEEQERLAAEAARLAEEQSMVVGDIDLAKLTSAQLATLIEGEDLGIEQKGRRRRWMTSVRVRDALKAKQPPRRRAKHANGTPRAVPAYRQAAHHRSARDAAGRGRDRGGNHFCRESELITSIACCQAGGWQPGGGMQCGQGYLLQCVAPHRGRWRAAGLWSRLFAMSANELSILTDLSNVRVWYVAAPVKAP